MPRKPDHPRSAQLRQAVLEYIAAHPDRPLKVRGLARELQIAGPGYPAFRRLIQDLLRDGELVLSRGRTLVLPQRKKLLVGTFRATRRGFGFIEVPPHPDLFVPPDRTRDALDGDTVAARLLPPRPGRPELAAEVVRIIERAPIRWVGVLEQHGRQWYVQPQGRLPAPRVHIDDPHAKSAVAGDLVVVEPLEHTLGTASVRGVIVERLGPPGQAQVRILGVVRRYDLPDVFSPEARREAHEALDRFDPDRITGREDLRGLTTITIDPVDARDYDDAISVEPLADGRMRLGVHIADVAWFVTRDGALDREARLRGNSVYFPGYVVPMLPEVLSNGVCSLQPGQTRYTWSVFIDYDAHGRVLDTRITRSVIRSRARLTYEQASAALEGRSAGPSVDSDEATGARTAGAAGESTLHPEVLELLRRAETLARRIRARRIAAGMIVLTLPEVEIRLDAQGQVVDARPSDTSFSHTIIEMFMVEANEAVSRFLARRGVPHIRRVHGPPDPDAARTLGAVVAALGHVPPRRLDTAGIASLLAAVKGRPEEQAINYLLLRSLAQAAYSASDEGHFALASEDYCHFTSPIRRYPDLVNSRLLEGVLGGGPRRRAASGRGPAPAMRRRGPRADPESSGDGSAAARATRTAQLPAAGADALYSTDELREIAAHCSFTERRAQDAEREAKTILLLELMARHVGEEFDGIITGVSSAGAFVQLSPFMAEGLLRREDLGREPFDFDRQRARLVGRRSGRILTLGQPVRVRVAAVDTVRLEMTLVPAEGPLAGWHPAGGDPGPGRSGAERHPGRRAARNRRGAGGRAGR